MSSLLSQLVYGRDQHEEGNDAGNSNDQNIHTSAATSAESNNISPPAKDESTKASISYLQLLGYEDIEEEDDDGGDEGDDSCGFILTQLSQESALSQSSNSPHNYQDAQSPQLLGNISQGSEPSPKTPRRQRAETISSLVYGNDSTPTRAITSRHDHTTSYGDYSSPANPSPQDAQAASYLSELIYGHPDEYGDDEEEAVDNGALDQKGPAKQPTKKKKWHDEFAEEEQEEEVENVNEIATNVLNALFSQTSAASVPPTPLPTDANNEAFENPLLASLKRDLTKEGKTEEKDDDEELTEEQQLDKRLRKELKEHKLQRHREWANFRLRWKRRKVDLRKEDDVGSAYLFRARESLEPKLLLESQEQSQDESKEEEEDSQPQQVEQVEDQYRPYDSEDEQVDLLQRLSQSIERQEEKEAKEMDPEYQKRKRHQEALEEAKRPFSETMDYWQQGKTQPDLQSLDFYYPRDVAPVAPSAGRKRKRDETIPTPEIVLRRETNYQPGQDPNKFFLFPLHHRRFASTSFVHHRQMVRVAARCIVKAAGERDDRLLRTLWQPKRTRFKRLQLLLAQTQEYGQNLATFLGHVWKDSRARNFVGKRLGIIGLKEFEPPPRLMGYTMETSLVQATSNKDRRKLVTRYSRKTMSSFSENPSTTLANATRKRRRMGDHSFALPTVAYISLPGTSPPAPELPLDETSLVFGPTDRRILFRHVGGIDDPTYKLTFSSLVTRLASRQERAERTSREGENQEENNVLSPHEDFSGEMRRIQQQLFTLVDQAPSTAKNDFYKRFQRVDPEAEIPLVQFYRTIMAFCSFVTSQCPQLKSHKTEKANQDDSDSNNDNPYDLLKVEMSDNEDERVSESGQVLDASALSMEEAANKIFDFCELHIKHNGLKAFPRIHLIYGLATIAKLFPSSAAEVFSAPVDANKNRTPFDLFRRMLEHLETESLLIEDDKTSAWMDDDELVRIGELEYALHRAVESFGHCIQRDPIDVRYHEWRLAALGASLLLCSGHKPGSRALPFPSSHYRKRGVGSSKGYVAESELRATLDKFQEVRLSTIEALKLLVQLTQRQPMSTRAHLAVSSFWEWKQVAALVIGSSCLNRTRMKEIRSSHMYHTVHWASHERPALGMRYLEILTRSEGDSCDVRLKQFAAAIELDPNNVEHWRSLVAALGPLGVDKHKATDRLFCVVKDCKECQMLRDGFAGDHYKLEARKNSGDWWGTDLIEWWHPHYLSTTLLVPDKSKTPALMATLENAILMGLSMIDPSLIKPQKPGVLGAGGSTSVNKPDLEWFWGGPVGDYKKFEEDDQEAKTDDLLPVPCAQVIRVDNGPEVVGEPRAKLPPEDEAVFLKLVVTCHLFGITHPYALEPVYELCRRSARINPMNVDHSSGEWRCLLELSRLGVDIVKVVQLYQANTIAEQESKKESKRRANPRFSQAQRAAVRDGLDRFGYGKWIDMSKYYDVLDGLSRFVIYDIYKWLLKYEGMEDRRGGSKRKHKHKGAPAK